MPPLIFAGRLPVGAMVRPDPGAVGPPASPPIWFNATDSSCFGFGPTGNVVQWEGGAALARNVLFNLDGTPFDAARAALIFSESTHAGLVIDDALPEGTPFSLAVLLHANAKESRTIATLQNRGDSDYMFLSGEDASFRLAAKTGGELLVAPDSGGIVLITIAVTPNATRIAINDAAPIIGKQGTLRGPVSLFLGCRGDARSLRNKIGCFDLFDVMIWPDTDVLDGETAAPAIAIQTWQERRNRGL